MCHCHFVRDTSDGKKWYTCASVCRNSEVGDRCGPILSGVPDETVQFSSTHSKLSAGGPCLLLVGGPIFDTSSIRPTVPPSWLRRHGGEWGACVRAAMVSAREIGRWVVAVSPSVTRWAAVNENIDQSTNEKKSCCQPARLFDSEQERHSCGKERGLELDFKIICDYRRVLTTGATDT
jgi:hypothetical protein